MPPLEQSSRTPQLGRSFTERATTAPVSTEIGAQRVSVWLHSIADSETRDRISHLLQTKVLQELWQGIAEGSPYLWGIATADPGWCAELMAGAPEDQFAALARRIQALPNNSDEQGIMRALRQEKARASLLVGLAEIAGIWPIMDATRAWTELADASVEAALAWKLLEVARTGRFHPPFADQVTRASGLIVLAMGKMGAFELNYSSDIDLIVFFDPAAPGLAPGSEVTPFFVRIMRGVVKILQERTPDGYVFRVDLRLRPDPASTQIAVPTDAALTYYESRGQNWERAALIKARPCAGDREAGYRFLRELSPFVWRKYLDYPAIADVHAMKRQIHAYRGHDEIAVEGHNIKLGRGGIREIEFFVQTQQLIAGGRNPSLRTPATLQALDALRDEGWIEPTARDELCEAYRFLRRVEHRLQMVADEQTHSLPSDADELRRLARFIGFAERDAFADALVNHLRKVQAHYARLFEDAPTAPHGRQLRFGSDADARETLDALSTMGFEKPLEAFTTIRNWLAGEHRVLRRSSARERLADIVPPLLAEFARSEAPNAALTRFDRFLSGAHKSARLFSMLRQNPDVLALFGTILGTAPRLADVVAARPEVMDGLVDPSFFGALPDEAQLAAQLSRHLSASASYEDVLDAARIFGQEQLFLLGARILSGTVSAAQAGEAFARVADATLQVLHQSVTRAFTAQHGSLPSQECAILALGKLGAREMTASSDLDLIVIYDFEGEHGASDGPRPLYGAQYFARLTQRVVSALTTQTNYGSLYQVDLRLRPSGRSGPVATSIDAFRTYQLNEAWTWEHMALTRARVVSASPAFKAGIEAIIGEVLRQPREGAEVAEEVVDMRRAIATEKGEADPWDLKYARGGLVDLEFLAQYLQLVHASEYPAILDTSTVRVFERAAALGLLEEKDSDLFRSASRLFHDLTQILRLCLSGPFTPATAGASLRAMLARAADVPDFPALESLLLDVQKSVRRSFERVLQAR